tara:strand:- start:664 stop:1125 length:462 start_codon:yes stop_codon:yes gene_type:complete
MNKKVAILLGSKNDMKFVEASEAYFKHFNVEHEVHIMSAHRTPEKVGEFARNARDNGYFLLIGAAGMAAHLAGALKAHSTLPVVGVPLPGGMMDGLDSLLATLQMPKGVPVATMTVGKAGFINAAILCAEILSLNDSEIKEKLDLFKKNGATI